MRKMMVMIVLVFCYGNYGAAQDFYDDFSSSVLDPGWSTNPGYGRISLTDHPGYLTYWFEGTTCPAPIASWCAGPSLQLERHFSGTQWVLGAKATYTYHWEVNGGHYQRLVVFFDNNNSVVFMRTQDSWTGYNSNSLSAYARLGSTQMTNGRLLQPTDVPVNGWTTGTYWYEIERNNDSLSMRYSYDGINYSNALTVQLPAGLGTTQKIVIDSDNWVTCGHRVDWDYLYVKSLHPTPPKVSKDIIGVDRIEDTPIFDVFGGDMFTYTIEVENPFAQAVYVMVSDLLDTCLAYVLDSFRVNGAAASNSAFASGDLLYADHLLDADETLSLAFDVQVQEAASVGWLFENVAWVTAYLNPRNISGTTLAVAKAIAPQGQVGSVPEPTTAFLFSAGLLALLVLECKRKFRK